MSQKRLHNSFKCCNHLDSPKRDGVVLVGSTKVQRWRIDVASFGHAQSSTRQEATHRLKRWIFLILKYEAMAIFG